MTTEPWHDPIADFPSGSNPQPGTVSNVIRPQPIRTGLGVSGNAAAAAAKSMNTKQTKGAHFLTDGLLYFGLSALSSQRSQLPSTLHPRLQTVSMRRHKR